MGSCRVHIQNYSRSRHSGRTWSGWLDDSRDGVSTDCEQGLRIARDQYQANLNQADFKAAAESARSKINQWVAQKTQERIKDILPPGSVDPGSWSTAAIFLPVTGRKMQELRRLRPTRPSTTRPTASPNRRALAKIPISRQSP